MKVAPPGMAEVVRPDTRGFGDSTPMPRDFPWTIDLVIDDFVQLMDSLGIDRCHLVSAKIGGTIARAFAARPPRARAHAYRGGIAGAL